MSFFPHLYNISQKYWSQWSENIKNKQNTWLVLEGLGSTALENAAAVSLHPEILIRRLLQGLQQETRRAWTDMVKVGMDRSGRNEEL